MVISNIVLFCYLVLAIVLWGHYGLFSAFLHLMLTIACGVLALAIWEPLVVGLLMDLPGNRYAWCLGLLAPFVLLLLGARAVQDRLVKTNMRFENITNMVGGGLFGLFSGILASGLLIIGVGMLPIGRSVLDYQPITLLPNGTLEGQAGKGLLLPVDRWASGFFAMLSRGSFYPTNGRPLAQYQPDLALRAVLNRIQPDKDASNVMHPDSMKIEGVAYYSAVDVSAVDVAALVDDPSQKTIPVLLVGTVWDSAEGVGTYDRDGGLRVAPAQVRLAMSQLAAELPVKWHRPLGVVMRGSFPEPIAVLFNREKHIAYTKTRTNARLFWAFQIDERDIDADKFLFVRMLRLPLPAIDQMWKRRYEQYVSAMFRRPDAAPTDPSQGPELAGGPSITAPDGGAAHHGGGVADVVEATADLPSSVSRHHIHGHQHELRDNGKTLFDGKGEIPRATAVSKKTRVDSLYTAPDEYMVRVHMHRESARSLFGQARQMGARVLTFFLQDSVGNQHHAIGFVWKKAATGAQYIEVNRLGSIQHVSQLPLSDMRREDNLYIYFAIPKGVGVSKLVVGKAEQVITGIGG